MNQTIKPILTVFFALSVVVFFARPGQAEPRAKQSAQAHYHKGMKAYTLGHFAEAIEEFEKAYDLRPESIFLYNIAQSHRQNNSPQRAIFFYRRYLEAEPGAKNRAEIEQRMKEIQAQLNAQTAIAPPPPTPPPPPAPPPVAQPIPAAAPVVAEPELVTRAHAEPSQGTGLGLRIAGIAVGTVGIGGVVAGVFLALHGNTLHEQATKPGSPYDDSKEQSSKTFRTLGWVCIGVGGAAVVAGGVLYFVGASSKPAPSSVAIAPFIAPGAGGAAISGRF